MNHTEILMQSLKGERARNSRERNTQNKHTLNMGYVSMLLCHVAGSIDQ